MEEKRRHSSIFDTHLSARVVCKYSRPIGAQFRGSIALPLASLRMPRQRVKKKSEMVIGGTTRWHWNVEFLANEIPKRRLM